MRLAIVLSKSSLVLLLAVGKQKTENCKNPRYGFRHQYRLPNMYYGRFTSHVPTINFFYHGLRVRILLLRVSS